MFMLFNAQEIISFVIPSPYKEVTESGQSPPQINIQIQGSLMPTISTPAVEQKAELSPTDEIIELPTLEPTVLPALIPESTLGRIVFTCTPEKFNQLCLMNADGSEYTRLTDRNANDYYPSFSTDGHEVIFVSNQTDQFEIFILDLKSKKESQVTEGMGNYTAPDISPDGQWVVFAFRMGSDSSIGLIPYHGGQQQALTDAKWNEIDPTWSPDGTQIAFAGTRGGYVELFVMNADGSNLHQVTQGIQGIGGRSAWSPDGKSLVFYAGPRGDRDIYTIEIASGAVRRLTSGGNNTGPCFSPDGNWIVFSSSRDGDHEIYFMRTDGSELTQLTDNSYDDWQPSWSIDTQ